MNKTPIIACRVIVKIVLCVMGLITFNGCLPIPHTSLRSPEIQGRVLDAQTQKPVAGAKVFLTEHPQVSTQTDSAGYFRIKERRKFHPAVTVPEGDWPPSEYWGCALTVTHTNYVTYVQNGPDDWRLADKGDLLVEPKP